MLAEHNGPADRPFFHGSGTCPMSYSAVVCGRLRRRGGLDWVLEYSIIPAMQRVIADREGAGYMISSFFFWIVFGIKEVS